MKLKLFDKKLIKNNFYTTSYFLKTKNILASNNINNDSTIQFKCFSKKPFMLAGVSECIQVIKSYLSKKIFDKLQIYYFEDGTIINPGQCVLCIKGPYIHISCLENIIDGILSRRSSVANNCFNFLNIINSDELIFMSDRSDDYHLLPYDGYAAYIAGVRKFSNNAHIHFIPNKSDVSIVGTMPHSLIQQFKGNTVKAFKAYKDIYHESIVVLVDYDNDVIKTLSKLKPYFDSITGIRLDTSTNMIDKSLKNFKQNKQNFGTSEKLIRLTRKWLDNNNGNHIKIICSSGNDLNKIKSFTKKSVPVDIYGIGSALTQLNLHFTADLVLFENKKEAKKGRKFLSIEGMKLYENEEFNIKF